MRCVSEVDDDHPGGRSVMRSQGELKAHVYSGNGQSRGVWKGREGKGGQGEMVLWRKLTS